MGNKKIVFLSLAVLLTVALFFVALRGNPDQTGTTPKPGLSIPKPVVEKTASVSFSPSDIPVKPLQTVGTNLVVDTQGKPITGVQVELSFDPSLVNGLQILPPADEESFFGNQGEYFILFNEVDKKTGKASYAIAISPTSEAKSGNGIIGRISFITSSSLNTPTSISFLENTIVTKRDETESVLKNTTPLTLTLSPQ